MSLIESLVDRAARLLEPEERTVIIGDLAESGIDGWPALRDVLSLALRRQSALWNGWRPWVAVLGVIGIVGLPLNLMAMLVLTSVGRQLTTHWKYGVSYSNGLTTPEEIALLVILSFALSVFSWTGGFVLAAVSRHAILTTGFLYLLLCSWPLLVGVSLPLRGLVNPEQAHRMELPLTLLILLVYVALQSVLVVIPTAGGIRCGYRDGNLNVPQAGILALATAVLTAGAIWASGMPAAAVVRWSGGVWDPGLGWQARLLPLILLSWPAGYVLANAVRREHKHEQR